ncbi:hypothetical protein Poli38472_004985 [Pythium oligandrum]|uniref:Uncharacterized protein n=1 Tax=Pythium oligandrum TaxID=41045 RepID=A0A8K1CAU8_PYTOL|nr:hypothetical protein Poli38472_004985 [Pythium oligandrum]|eukprot:TMW59916.1 hypothetical protein Poli38472_004985 [Pythium oligandrum]
MLAEVERDVLRIALNHQTNAALRWERMIIRELQSPLPPSVALPRVNVLWLLQGQFLHDIEAAYPMTDSVINKVHWCDKGAAISLASDGQVCVEFLSRVWSPLELREATKTSWKCMYDVWRPPTHKMIDFTSSENWLSMQFYRMLLFKGQEIRLCVSTVIQRFVEVNREVRVWRSMVTVGTVGIGEWEGIFADETGWSICTRSEIGGTSSQICTRITPVSLIPKHPKLEDFIYLLGGMSDSDFSLIDEAIESATLDKSVTVLSSAAVV